jgi:hypothetical protein
MTRGPHIRFISTNARESRLLEAPNRLASFVQRDYLRWASNSSTAWGSVLSTSSRFAHAGVMRIRAIRASLRRINVPDIPVRTLGAA